MTGTQRLTIKQINSKYYQQQKLDKNNDSITVINGKLLTEPHLLSIL